MSIFCFKFPYDPEITDLPLNNFTSLSLLHGDNPLIVLFPCELLKQNVLYVKNYPY